MIEDNYKNIIFTDNVEELKEKLKKYESVLVTEISNTGNCGYYRLSKILSDSGFVINLDSDYMPMFLTAVNFTHSVKYGRVCIHIKNIDKITSKQSLYCYKVNFFNLLNSITNKQIYFIIDIKYKDYVFNQIEEYNKHINRLRSFGEIHNQVIFVDDIEKVKQNINTETEMFKEIDGNKCKDIDLFYDQFTEGWNYPKDFARNFDAIDEWLNDTFDLWDRFKESKCSAIFHYIKNIKDILPNKEDNNVLATICYLLHEVDNERMFYLIDRKDMEYFLELVEKIKSY